mgnify:CR=1 FL=1
MADTSNTTKTMPYSLAEQLRSPEEMAAYLNAWLEEAPDDTVGFVCALGNIVRSRGLSQVAHEAGLSEENLDEALSGNSDTSFATVLKVARAWGAVACGSGLRHPLLHRKNVVYFHLIRVQIVLL